VLAIIKSWFQPVNEAGGRYTGLDGLRGLAMMMVIFIHLHLVGIGWIGLSSFFVLSGFLITKVLLSDRKKSNSFGAYMRRFYGRRSLRIFPIYYVYLTIVLVGTFFIGRLEPVRENLPYAYLYIFNWHQVFNEPHHSRMLNHLWSLSVEEQFYLLWPFLLAFTPRRLMPWLAGALVVSGPVIRYAISQYWPEGPSSKSGAIMPQFMYVMTITHLDAFALGALINFINYRPKTWHYIAFISLALLLGGYVNGGLWTVSWDPKQMPFTLGWPLYQFDGLQYIWGYSLVNLFWYIVICGILTEGRVKRFFSTRILDYLGKRSYSTYIVHFPVLGLFAPWWKMSQEQFGNHMGTLVMAPVYLAVVIVLAALAYRYIEMPMLDLKERLWPDKPAKTDAKVSTAAERNTA
jgi:peptidoglycan/LPS O-acetylase OafA/YrhL